MKEKDWKFFNIRHIFQCPVCGRKLDFRTGSLLCKKGHCFDISAKGYVNFIPNQKPLKGYDALFFENRRQIFEGGFYAHILSALTKLLAEKKALRTIVDAGCGEGFYALELAKLENKELLAFDIAKEAVKIASRGSSPVRFLVADITNIPLRDHSADCVLDVFTTANYSEFQRILSHRGLIVKVIPGSCHLQELRQAVQDQLRSDEYSNQDVTAYFQQHFHMEDRWIVSRTLPVSTEQLQALVNMTPLLFNVDKSRADFSGITHITIEAEILTGKML